MIDLRQAQEMAADEKAFYDKLEAEMPALWRACYPRIYQEPACGPYYSAKKPARQLAMIGLKVIQNLVGPSETYEFHLASHLAKFQVPLYWLSRDIAEALRHTTPPGVLDWYHMPMPFEAAAFMLPKGSLVHRTDGNVSFICYGRFRAGEEYTSPLVPGKPYASMNGGMMLAAQVDSGYFIHWNIPLNHYGPRLTLQELQDLIALYSTEKDIHATAVPLRDGGMKPADFELGLEVAHYVFSTILLMTARPELVTPDRLINRVPARKGKEAREFWSPAIIGEHYKLHRAPGRSQGGSHASPRLHWVQGYFREQPYGPGRVQHRAQWIDPYTRGFDEEESELKPATAKGRREEHNEIH